MDDYSAQRQLFQLTSLSVLLNQLSYHLEEDTHMYMLCTHTHTMADFSLGFIINFHQHSALTGPLTDTQWFVCG